MPYKPLSNKEPELRFEDSFHEFCNKHVIHQGFTQKFFASVSLNKSSANDAMFQYGGISHGIYLDPERDFLRMLEEKVRADYEYKCEQAFKTARHAEGTSEPDANSTSISRSNFRQSSSE